MSRNRYKICNSTGCGGIYKAASGSIQYPASPGQQYPADSNCIWTITVSFDKVRKSTEYFRSVTNIATYTMPPTLLIGLLVGHNRFQTRRVVKKHETLYPLFPSKALIILHTAHVIVNSSLRIVSVKLLVLLLNAWIMKIL